MNVDKICNCTVIVAERDTTVRAAAKLMRRHHVGDLVIVEKKGGENVPIGIVTDRDIVIEVLAADADIDALTVGDIVTHEVSTVAEDTDLWVALEKMRKLGVRRMPVVDQQGSLFGILTIDDTLHVFAEGLNDMVTLINQEITQEARYRKATST